MPKETNVKKIERAKFFLCQNMTFKEIREKLNEEFQSSLSPETLSYLNKEVFPFSNLNYNKVIGLGHLMELIDRLIVYIRDVGDERLVNWLILNIPTTNLENLKELRKLLMDQDINWYEELQKVKKYIEDNRNSRIEIKINGNLYNQFVQFLKERNINELGEKIE